MTRGGTRHLKCSPLQTKRIDFFKLLPAQIDHWGWRSGCTLHYATTQCLWIRPHLPSCKHLALKAAFVPDMLGVSISCFPLMTHKNLQHKCNPNSISALSGEKMTIAFYFFYSFAKTYLSIWFPLLFKYLWTQITASLSMLWLNQIIWS